MQNHLMTYAANDAVTKFHVQVMLRRDLTSFEQDSNIISQLESNEFQNDAE